ncbi:SPOR domain-containing protein [Flavobacterium sp. RHBU_3]|uniref:HU domain-containing protein n=1 Tax=Flavobacterium sp. RHBU_3 TaxID=3391184 RepID=UPI0039849202
MKIEKHISALLYRYQCVTIPGFGAFLTEIRPAQHNAVSHTFYPPKKVVSFNANVKNNDGLLANHIAQTEKISYEAAVEAISDMVKQWKHSLNNMDVLFLKNIGQIGLNTEGNLVFTPDTPVNYLTEAFGLSTVISPAIKREELKAVVEELEEKAPIIFTPERKRDYSYLKYAAVFALLIGGGLFGYKNYNDRQAAAETLAVQNAVQAKVEQRIQQATFFIENPLPAVTLPVKEDTEAITDTVATLPYHVVAGAYKSEANADKAVANLVTKGHKAHRLELNKFGLYPVVYGSYATYNQAQDSARAIRINGDKEAWVLVK